MTIIPAIDIINGKCVRLTNGDFAQKKIYNEDPLEVAKQFEDAGIKRLHLVDLDGAKHGAIKNLEVLQKIAGGTGLQIDFGGGIHDENDLAAVFSAGAAMATIGSLAIKNPLLLKEWLARYGAEKFFIGADVMDRSIKIGGWLEDGATDIFSYLKHWISNGATQFFCTDIRCDGAMQGPSLDLYRSVIAEFPGIQLTASGGVTGITDLAALERIGCSGAIVGKAIYENNISVRQIKEWQNNATT